MTKPIPTAIAAQAMLMGATAIFIDGGAITFTADVMSDPNSREPGMDRLRWRCTAHFNSAGEATAIFQKVIASGAFTGAEIGRSFVSGAFAFIEGMITKSQVGLQS